MKYFYLIILVFFSLTTFFSQSKKAFQQDYLLAKMMFEDSNYVESMHAFKTLTIANKNNPFSEYAYYFCGLSAYKAGKNSDARFILLEGEKSNSDWDKSDELYYLLGVVLLEEGDSSRAFTYLNKIKDKEVLEDANRLLEFYEINQVLNEVDDLAALKQKLLEHPESLKIAKKLAKNLNKKGNTTEEKIYLEYLIQDYGLDVDKFSKGIFRKSEKKSDYSIAIILPFNHEDRNKLAKRLRFYEMYKGIQFAVDSLKSEGISIVLHVYDSKNDSSTVAKILMDPKVLDSDLLFGPIFSKPSQLAAEFAQEHEKMYVNPLSGNQSITIGNRFVYLFSPSYQMEAKKVAQYADTLPYGNVTIIYGSKEKDSIKAFAYKLEVERLGKNVRDIKKFDRSNMEQLGPYIARNAKYSEDTLSHIFIASDQNFTGASILSTVEEHDLQIPLFITIDWMNIDMIGNDYDLFHRRGVHFVGINYLDIANNLELQRFRANTFEIWHTKQQSFAEYSAVGYESVMVFGKALNEFGNSFYNGLNNKNEEKGALFPGYEYKEHCNGVVPIYKLDQGYNVEILNSVDDE